MYKKFFDNFSNNIKRTTEQFSNKIKKGILFKRYIDLLKNPKVQKFTNVNPNEYNQQISFFKQTLINKKKEYQRALNELKQKKPEDLVKYIFFRYKLFKIKIMKKLNI